MSRCVLSRFQARDELAAECGILFGGRFPWGVLEDSRPVDRRLPVPDTPVDDHGEDEVLAELSNQKPKDIRVKQSFGARHGRDLA